MRKAPPPSIITFRIRLQHMNFGRDTSIQSIACGFQQTTCRYTESLVWILALATCMTWDKSLKCLKPASSPVLGILLGTHIIRLLQWWCVWYYHKLLYTVLHIQWIAVWHRGWEQASGARPPALTLNFASYLALWLSVLLNLLGPEFSHTVK